MVVYFQYEQLPYSNTIPFLPCFILQDFFSILEQRVLKVLAAKNLKRGCSNIFCKTIGVLLLEYASQIFFQTRLFEEGWSSSLIPDKDLLKLARISPVLLLTLLYTPYIHTTTTVSYVDFIRDFMWWTRVLRLTSQDLPTTLHSTYYYT